MIVTGSSHLRMRIATVHMNIIKCGYCSRAATITLSRHSLRRLFEGGVYSGCGVYSRKYGIYSQPIARLEPTTKVYHSFLHKNAFLIIISIKIQKSIIGQLCQIVFEVRGMWLIKPHSIQVKKYQYFTLLYCVICMTS